jgi:hypothetical protein
MSRYDAVIHLRTPLAGRGGTTTAIRSGPRRRSRSRNRRALLKIWKTTRAHRRHRATFSRRPRAIEILRREMPPLQGGKCRESPVGC